MPPDDTTDARFDGVREVARHCVTAGVAAAAPERVVADCLSLDGDDLTVTDADGRTTTTDLSAFERVLVVGGGKAAGGFARGLVDLFGDRIDDGVVVTTDLGDESNDDDDGAAGAIRLLPGDHPTPSERSVASTREVLRVAEGATADDLLVVLLTGGGSALLTAPARGVDLAALRETTDALLKSGADIHEINAVRKHLSAVKGGRLAARAAPATVLGLAISDVVGDDLGTVASGPTTPDRTTFADALDVLDRHGIDAPASIRERLERGATGESGETDVASSTAASADDVSRPDETPADDDPVFATVRTFVLANGHTALSAARDAAADAGYDATCLVSGRLRGEARETGRTLAAVAEEVAATGNPVAAPAVLVAGGETTVTVAGDGLGGPNGELALAAAIEFGDWRQVGGETPVALAAVDTDGLDGSTDAAGALVDPTTVGEARGMRGAARDALAKNDSHGFLGDQDALLRTGPTGTNVNDLVVVVVGDPEG